MINQVVLNNLKTEIGVFSNKLLNKLNKLSPKEFRISETRDGFKLSNEIFEFSILMRLPPNGTDKIDIYFSVAEGNNVNYFYNYEISESYLKEHNLNYNNVLLQKSLDEIEKYILGMYGEFNAALDNLKRDINKFLKELAIKLKDVKSGPFKIEEVKYNKDYYKRLIFENAKLKFEIAPVYGSFHVTWFSGAENCLYIKMAIFEKGTNAFKEKNYLVCKKEYTYNKQELNEALVKIEAYIKEEVYEFENAWKENFLKDSEGFVKKLTKEINATTGKTFKYEFIEDRKTYNEYIKNSSYYIITSGNFVIRIDPYMNFGHYTLGIRILKDGKTVLNPEYIERQLTTDIVYDKKELEEKFDGIINWLVNLVKERFK